MTKQLSDCCKAGIRLTGEDRPKSFACEECGRIIGTPVPAKKKKQKHTRTKNEYREDYVVDTKDFRARVVLDGEGFQKLKVLSPVWYRHQLQKFKLGEVVTLYVSSRKPKRSLQQNAYYWGVYLPLIAKETGERDIDGLHRLFSGKFLSEGIKEILGERVRVTKSTATLSKSDFTEYIMAIEAETGISAPPTENYYD